MTICNIISAIYTLHILSSLCIDVSVLWHHDVYFFFCKSLLRRTDWVPLSKNGIFKYSSVFFLTYPSLLFVSTWPMASTSSPYHELSFSLFSTICKYAYCHFFSSVLVYFASPTSPIKFGLLPSYPHIFTAAAPSPIPWLASELQMSMCTWHVPGVRQPCPMGAPQAAWCCGSHGFPSFLSVPSVFPCTSGILFPCRLPNSLRSSGCCLLLPLHGLGVWQLPCLQVASCVCPAFPHCCLLPGSAGFLLSSILPRLGISILRTLLWREKYFVQVKHNSGSHASYP